MKHFLSEAQKVEAFRHIIQYEKYVSDTPPTLPSLGKVERIEYKPSLVNETLLKKVPFHSLTLTVSLEGDTLTYKHK